ncbi:hypothetical protein DFH07DRAFT_946882 [Mycena maculata]|uniref:Uncharacterized protein n=1 Tax=Mycena maculata TaxID=230809 RepID=A0AAD7MKW0_9AGAR|nr:hypothetical protein DFH07DRAFT_946882 [Mycena maculata]
MFFTKSFIAAAVLIGAASAQFTGTATIGFTGTTNCGCPATNGPFAVSIPAALVGSEVCCDVSITVSYNGKTISAVFNGIFDAGAGTENIQLSEEAFAVLEDNSGETSLSPVTWEFSS